jgi:hypothetical protein
MQRTFLLPLLVCPALVAQAPNPDAKASAAVKVGTSIEKAELQGEAITFKVAVGTKLYAWTKVTGAAESVITVAFSKGDRTSKQELKVPRSPYRTNAYRTFRKGDEGSWTVKVLAADGTELGTAAFTVELE